MTNYRKPSATADVLRGLPRKPDAARMVAEALYNAPEPQRQWYDAAIELGRFHRERELQRQAEEDAAQAAAIAPQTPAGILAAALRGGASPTTALNSAELLRAALAGGTGIINGQNG